MSNKAKIGDVIRTTTNSRPYYEEGDIGVVKESGESDCFVDFTPHTSTYHDGGNWYVGHGNYEIYTQQPIVQEHETQKEKLQMKRKQDVAVGDRVVYTGDDYGGQYKGKEGVVIHLSGSREPGDVPTWVDIKISSNGGEPSAYPSQWEYAEEQQSPAAEQPTAPPPAEPPSMVISPKHYVLFPEQGIEVRHVNKAWMDKIDNEGEYLSHHEAAWLVQATQYIFRSPFKGSTIEDLNKAIQSLQYVVESMNARKASK